MKSMLVFCASVDTAHRLTRLLQLFLAAAARDKGEESE